MIGHIYLIRNSVNGKGYVGQTTVGVAKRFTKHKIESRRGKDFALYQAMRKYGVESFTVETITSCKNAALLNELEEHYITFFGTFYSDGHGYNMTKGGDHFPRVWRHSEETKSRMSVAQKARKRAPISEEHRKKLRAIRIGCKTSDETKIKLSAVLMGNKRSVGRKHSLATKAKMSLSRTGLPSANKGRPWSEARRVAYLKQFEGVIQ